MYLLINGNKHTVSKRIHNKDTIKYLTVSPTVDVEVLTGTIRMYRDDDFLLCEDQVDKYERKTMTGTLLVMTNKPVPQPVDQTTKPEYRLSMLEQDSKNISEHLAETDEIAIELFEAGLAQEAINAEQDEAIIEIYEMMEAVNNG